ncbi:MAG: hypothetical protein HC888_15245 [Candidatus Competibacteraceae bacterium]|nr:hypothetical protein [Candidatus Competibacteraceae bacterium]
MSQVTEGGDDLDEQIISFIGSELVGLVSLNPVTATLTISDLGRLRGLNSKNIKSIVYNWVFRKFAGKVSRRTHPRDIVGVLFDNSIQRYCMEKGPTEEINGYYAAHRGSFPQLDSARVPTYLAHGDGGWAEMYRLAEPLFRVYQLESHLEQEGFIKFLVGMVARTYEPGCFMPQMLLLYGAGGCGKSTVARTLALKRAPYVDVHTVGDLSGTRNIERIRGASVVNLEEYDVATSKHDVAGNKSFITTTDFKIRLPYREDSETVYATWALVGTMNAKEIPNDGAENRRIWPVQIKGGTREGAKRNEFLEANREFLTAWAAHLYFNGYNPAATAQHVEDLKQTNEAFTATASEADLIRSYSSALADIIKGSTGLTIGLRSSDIWSLVSTSFFHSRRAREFVDALEETGWVRVRLANRSTVWVPDDTEIGRITPAHPDNLAMIRRALAATQVEEAPHGRRGSHRNPRNREPRDTVPA